MRLASATRSMAERLQVARTMLVSIALPGSSLGISALLSAAALIDGRIGESPSVAVRYRFGNLCLCSSALVQA